MILKQPNFFLHAIDTTTVLNCYTTLFTLQIFVTSLEIKFIYYKISHIITWHRIIHLILNAYFTDIIFHDKNKIGYSNNNNSRILKFECMMKDILSRMQNTVMQYHIESTTFYKLSRSSQNQNIIQNNIIYFIIFKLYMYILQINNKLSEKHSMCLTAVK